MQQQQSDGHLQVTLEHGKVSLFIEALNDVEEDEMLPARAYEVRAPILHFRLKAHRVELVKLAIDIKEDEDEKINVVS